MSAQSHLRLARAAGRHRRRLAAPPLLPSSHASKTTAGSAVFPSTSSPKITCRESPAARGSSPPCAPFAAVSVHRRRRLGDQYAAPAPPTCRARRGASVARLRASQLALVHRRRRRRRHGQLWPNTTIVTSSRRHIGPILLKKSFYFCFRKNSSTYLNNFAKIPN